MHARHMHGKARQALVNTHCRPSAHPCPQLGKGCANPGEKTLGSFVNTNYNLNLLSLETLSLLQWIVLLQISTSGKDPSSQPRQCSAKPQQCLQSGANVSPLAPVTGHDTFWFSLCLGQWISWYFVTLEHTFIGNITFVSMDEGRLGCVTMEPWLQSSWSGGSISPWEATRVRRAREFGTRRSRSLS